MTGNAAAWLGRIFGAENLAAVVALFAGVGLSALLSATIFTWEKNSLRAAFGFSAERHTQILQDTLSSEVEAVQSIAALYAASEQVERVEFAKFAAMEMAEQPNIKALEWIPKVKGVERQAYEGRARNQGLSDFSFTERHAQGEMVTAAERDVYFPVYFVEPLKGNEAALGFDLASNPARLEALNAARDSGKLQATARITLVQETGSEYGLLVFQPIYRDGDVPISVAARREKLMGFGLGVLRIGNILEAVHARMPEQEKLRITVMDLSAPAGQRVLFPRGASEKQPKNDRCVAIPLEIGGRSWSAGYCPGGENYYLTGHGQSVIALIIGLLMTGVLAAYLRALEKKRADAEGREFELNKLRLEQESIAADLTRLIDTANAPIFGVDRFGHITEWNQKAAEITGYQKDEVMHCNLVNEFVADDYKGPVKAVLDRALKGEETANYEFPLSTKAGGQVYILLNSTSRRDASGKIVGVVGVGQDITEIKKSQAQVIQASKLATLGEMATSVAHELNQPLNVIRLAAGNSRRKLAKGTADTEYLDHKLRRIEAQTVRSAAIIDHMRMFGRKADEEAAPLNPGKVIENALDLMGEQLRLAGIDIVTDIAKDCPSVIGHTIQLEQVVLNLLANARDAMEAMDGEARITLRVSADEENVTIEVEDSGGGIPKAVLPRIFEPFYTTKELGKGTGLGLSVSYGIIRDMGGSIEAKNVEGGAIFTITLPIS